MKQKHHKAEQIVGLLRQVEAKMAGGQSVEQVCKALAIGPATLFIEPGSPWENAYIESFNSRLRHELLSVELFGSLQEAQVLAEQHRLEYSHRRPHSALGYRVFAATRIPPAASPPPEYTSTKVVNSLTPPWHIIRGQVRCCGANKSRLSGNREWGSRSSPFNSAFQMSNSPRFLEENVRR